ncbi:MAG: DUF4153 domain-containing protein [Candidatus Absconditabacterales bacterium]
MQSIRSFFNSRWESLQAYPAAYICAVGIAIAGVILNHQPDSINVYNSLNSTLARIIVTGLFMLPLAIAPVVRSDNRKSGRQWLAFVLGAVYFWFLPTSIQAPMETERIWMILSVLFARSISLCGIAYHHRQDQDTVREGSWEFLSKLAIALVSAVIIGGGVAISVVSIEYLFDLQVNDTTYTDIWLCAFALVGSTVRLVSLSDRDKQTNYMQLLRFFGLYIFLPLAILYACILLLYALQIAITQELPRGVVTWMVVGYTCFGMIGYLFTYMLRRDYASVKRIHQGYFISVLVFSILLFVAIGVRINEYGLTSPRYLIVAFGLWMVIMSIISLTKAKYSLTAIVSTLVILLGISTFGPQSASQLPIDLQYKKIIRLLETNNLLVDGYIQPLAVRVDASDPESVAPYIKDIYHTADYLAQQKNSSILANLSTGQVFTQLLGTNQRSVAETFMVALGVDRISSVAVGGDGDEYINYYYGGNVKALDISDYSYIIPLAIESKQISPVSGMQLVFVDGDKGHIKIAVGKKSYDIDLHKHINTIREASKKTDGSTPALEIVGSNYVIILTEFGAQQTATDTYTINSYGGYMLLK